MEVLWRLALTSLSLSRSLWNVSILSFIHPTENRAHSRLSQETNFSNRWAKTTSASMMSCGLRESWTLPTELTHVRTTRKTKKIASSLVALVIDYSSLLFLMDSTGVFSGALRAVFVQFTSRLKGMRMQGKELCCQTQCSLYTLVQYWTHVLLISEMLSRSLTSIQ